MVVVLSFQKRATLPTGAMFVEEGVPPLVVEEGVPVVCTS
jgi:hypothetical protein